MRRLIPVSLFSILVPVFLALPVTTVSAEPTARPVRPVVQSLPVTGVDRAALAGSAGAPAPSRVGTSTAQSTSTAARRPFLLTGKKLTKPFSTLGVSWQADSGSMAVAVSVRTRSAKGWSPWSALETADDDGPDALSREAKAPGVRTGTAPSWVGKVDGVQVRMDVPSGPAPRDVRIELVDPGSSAADARIGQGSAPRSSAVAATLRPRIITRAQWGADESLRSAKPAYASSVKVAYVHHTASTNDYTAQEAAQQVRGFYAYHTQSLGWSDIGYNFLVDKFGRVYEGRYGGVERAVIGAHAGGFNTGTVGVSMIGTYTSVAPSTSTLNAVRDLLAWKLSLNGVNPLGKQTITSAGGSTSKYAAGTAVTVNTIVGHRDTNNTACPGDLGYSKLPALRRAVADRIASPSTPTEPDPTPTSSPEPTVKADVTTAAIDTKYASLGGSSGFLGEPTDSEAAASSGRFRSYQGGSIYWSMPTGAHEVHGSISDRWATLDRERSPLGFPISDELGTSDRIGRFNRFEAGSIYWSPGTGAWEVRGAIRQAWSALGWEQGTLGYPLTDESPARDGLGRYNDFQNGSIFWTAGTGAFAVQGSIRATWSGLGRETGPLGYPLTHESVAPDRRGRYNHFTGGSVYWSPETGAREVRGAIRQRWASMGWETSALGYPISNEYAVAGGRRSDFQGGSILFDSATGATTVR